MARGKEGSERLKLQEKVQEEMLQEEDQGGLVATRGIATRVTFDVTLLSGNLFEILKVAFGFSDCHFTKVSLSQKHSVPADKQSRNKNKVPL